MARRYQMRAKDSVTGAAFVWLLSALDFSGTGYPGPNSPTNIVCLGMFDDGTGLPGYPIQLAHNTTFLQGLIAAGGNYANLLRWGVGANDRSILGDSVRVSIQRYEAATEHQFYHGSDVRLQLGSSMLLRLPLLQLEQASPGAQGAGYGQWWVKNTTPCVPRFVDDAGNDTPLGGIVDIVTIAGTSFTFGWTHFGQKIARCTSATAVAGTVPTNATFAAPVGTVLTARQAGAGPVTFAGADGTVTINPQFGCTLKTAGQGATVQFTKVATNEWDASGNFELSP